MWVETDPIFSRISSFSDHVIGQFHQTVLERQLAHINNLHSLSPIFLILIPRALAEVPLISTGKRGGKQIISGFN